MAYALIKFLLGWNFSQVNLKGKFGRSQNKYIKNNMLLMNLLPLTIKLAQVFLMCTTYPLKPLHMYMDDYIGQSQFMFVTFFQCIGGCVESSLGMENGAIPDNKLTASTEQSANTPAKNGRVNYASGSSWCARTSDTNPYLQIDLQTLHIICAVSTQGNSQADQWVKTYTLQLSTDGITWTHYKELGGQVKVCYMGWLRIISHLASIADPEF